MDPETSLRLLVSGRSVVRAALPGWVGPDAGPPAAADTAAALGLVRLTPVVAGPLAAAAAPWRGDLVLAASAAASQYDALREVWGRHGTGTRPLAALALAGSGFHGQHGRPWQTLPGNLHLAGAWPCDLPAAVGRVLPAWPAVALAEAVADLAPLGPEPRIKWVNDVLLGGAKVAGTLTAVRVVAGRIRVVFVGVGLNLAAAPRLVTAGAALPATALAAVPGGAPSLGVGLARVLSGLATRFAALDADGPASLLADYRRWSAVIGRDVVVWADGGTGCAPLAAGRVTAIDDGLGLVLAGHPGSITAGRLEFSESR
ncbi:hypothetical protein KDM41_06610 [bacterium]|nr:hypothetical protein [bacterium]